MKISDLDILYIAIGGAAIGLIVSLLVRNRLSVIAKKAKNDYWEHIVRLIKDPVLFLGFVIGIYFTKPLWNDIDLPFNQSRIMFFLTLISVSWLVISSVKGIKFVVLSKYDISTKDNLKARKIHTQFRYFENLLIFIVVIIAVSIALMSIEKIREFGYSLLASAGVAGIIVGFAAQRSISLVLAGFQIAITQPIRLDDVVIVEGEWGWIEEITMTYVVVRIWDKRRLIVPINYFIEKPFQNWTRTEADILGTVFVYVDYGFPVDKLRNKISELLKETDKWDGNVNVIQVTDATEKTMELRILVSASDSPSAWDLRVYLREKIIAYIASDLPDFLPNFRIRNKEVDALEKK
ncbi:mechanosensitive ion channel family protein [Saccharicrinis sp. FJH54]|uniref:mechanosensitive ion channel family protein n=1 Tax=Saccharicrinis sp. FJH54 TaxID=3344665 RepID=UPI0035D5090A